MSTDNDDLNDDDLSPSEDDFIDEDSFPSDEYLLSDNGYNNHVDINADVEQRDVNIRIDTAATERKIYITATKTNSPSNQRLSVTRFRFLFCVIHRSRSDTDSTREAQLVCTCSAFYHPFERFLSSDEAKDVVEAMFSSQEIPFSIDRQRGQSLLWKELIADDSSEEVLERQPLQGFDDVVMRISEAAARVAREASESGRKEVEMAITIDKRSVVQQQDFERLIPQFDVQVSATWNPDDPELYLAIQRDYFSESTEQSASEPDEQDYSSESTQQYASVPNQQDYFSASTEQSASASPPPVDVDTRIEDMMRFMTNHIIQLTEWSREFLPRSSELDVTSGSAPPAKSAVEALEKFIYKGSSEDGEESTLMTCAICMEEVMIGSQLTRMPCSHLFHGDCLSQWLCRNQTCPLCRHELTNQ